MLSISAPADMTVTADQVCGQSNCAQVVYTFTVSGGYPPYRLVCTPVDSGGLFLVGTHTVSCLAQDSAGDSTPYASFTVTVAAPDAGGGTSDGSGGGSSGGGTSGGSGGGTTGAGSGGSGGSGTGGTGAQTGTVPAVKLIGEPQVGRVLTARVARGSATRYLWQLRRAGTWRRLVGQTKPRLLVQPAYAGCRLRVRVTMAGGRALYSPVTAPVQA
jgi:hypothetical protein